MRERQQKVMNKNKTKLNMRPKGNSFLFCFRHNSKHSGSSVSTTF